MRGFGRRELVEELALSQPTHYERRFQRGLLSCCTAAVRRRSANSGRWVLTCNFSKPAIRAGIVRETLIASTTALLPFAKAKEAGLWKEADAVAP